MDLPGTSNSPPLSAARVRSARAQYGHAVDRYIEQLRVGDPPADDLVRAWERMPPGDGQRMLTRAIDHGIESVPDPPAELVTLFKSLDHVPFWVDWDRMYLASRKILRNGLLPAMAFTAYAAPHSYFATANRPLAFTEQLADQTVVRYRQTTRFVIEMFMPRNLQRHADGFKLAVLVRIRHARVRRRILQSDQWEHDGRAPQIPLNQSHMAMSAILFSYFVVQGMRRLGGHFTSGEVESVTLTWRYAAHLLGIDPEIVPTSEEEIRRHVDVAFSLEFDPDDTAKRLARSMVEAAPAFMRIRDERLASLFVRVLYAVSRRLLGDRLADGLGYPRTRALPLFYGGFAVMWIADRFPMLIPRALRPFLGMRFWLATSDYETDFRSLAGD